MTDARTDARPFPRTLFAAALLIGAALLASPAVRAEDGSAASADAPAVADGSGAPFDAGTTAGLPSGTELADVCRSASERAAASGKFPEGRCKDAMLYFFRTEQNELKVSSRARFCLDGQMTFNEIADLVVQHVERTPEAAGLPADQVIAGAMAYAHPCPPPGPDAETAPN